MTRYNRKKQLLTGQLFFFISTFFFFPAFAASTNSSDVTLSIQNTKGQPVNDIVVWLTHEDGSPVQSNNEQKPVVVSQQNKKFMPYLSVAHPTSDVVFTNQDNITHHIYSINTQNSFSFKIRAGQPPIARKFSHKGTIAMGCNIHDWMSGYLLIVDSERYGITNESGNISMNQLSHGRYNINIWHPQLQTENNQQVNTVNITNNNTLTVRLSTDLAPIPDQTNADDFDFLEDY